MKKNKKLSYVAKFFNNRYGVLDWDSYHLPNTLNILARLTDLPHNEFKNTELEFEIYHLFYMTYIVDIVDRLSYVTFSRFLRNNNNKIDISFYIKGSEKIIYFTVDTSLNIGSEVERVIKEIEGY